MMWTQSVFSPSDMILPSDGSAGFTVARLGRVAQVAK
jgi:hypothetical protein